MSKTYQWYYNGSAIGGATAKTHTLTSGQTDSNLIECRVQVDYGADQVAALAKYVVTAPTVTDDFNRANENLEASANWTDDLGGVFDIVSNQVRVATAFGEAGGADLRQMIHVATRLRATTTPMRTNGFMSTVGGLR